MLLPNKTKANRTTTLCCHFKTSYVTTKQFNLYSRKESKWISKHPMLLPNPVVSDHSAPCPLISKHPMLLPNRIIIPTLLFSRIYFKTSYVTTKPTVLSHFSANQFPRNRSTAGFYSNFTNRRSIFIMIPENASFPCKIRLFSMFTKIPAGKPLL